MTTFTLPFAIDYSALVPLPSGSSLGLRYSYSVSGSTWISVGIQSLSVTDAGSTTGLNTQSLGPIGISSIAVANIAAGTGIEAAASIFGTVSLVTSFGRDAPSTLPSLGMMTLATNGSLLASNQIALTGTTRGADIGVSSSGVTTVVWSELGADNNGFGISLQRYTATGLPLPGRQIANSVVAGDQVRPDLHVRSDGTMFLSYLTETAGSGALFIDPLAANGTSGGARLRVSGANQDANYNEMAVLSNGTMVHVYEDETASTVRMRLLSDAGTFLTGSIEVHLPSGRGNSGRPDVAALPDGGFVVAWRQFIASGETVFYRLYDADGTARGGPVNTFQQDSLAPDTTPYINVLGTGAFSIGQQRVYFEGPTAFDDVLSITSPGMLDGLQGNDFLDGSTGNDLLIGGAGYDIIEGRAGDDVIHGGATGSTSTLTQILYGGAGSDIITTVGGSHMYGGPGNDFIRGGAGSGSGSFDDLIYGGSGDDILLGRGGDDLIYGGDGNDIIRTGSGTNTVYGGAGDDILNARQASANFGSPSQVILDGGIGNDRLIGGPGDDSLYGGAGVDFIEGGAGDDYLVGGGQVDRFIFRAIVETDLIIGPGPTPGTVVAGWGDDVIADFTDGVDRIQIDRRIATSFADLDITLNGAHAVIDFGSTASIIVLNIGSNLDGSDFNFLNFA